MANFLVEPNLLLMASEGFFSFLKPLYWVFGRCMDFLLSVLNNEYFLAIIIFTVVTRLIVLPLNIRQQKTTAKSARLQPKIQKIQKKYPDPKDRMKLNQEMQALYDREGHNPMQMGCGTLIFQMIFLMGIVGIIYYPLSYVINMSNINDYSDQLIAFLEGLDYKGNYLQLGILENWADYKESLIAQFPELFTADRVEAIESFRQGMYLFNLDMTKIPNWKDGIIVIVPILSFLTSLGSTVVSMLIQRKTNPAASQQMGSMIGMMLIMPFFSLYIAFQVPAAVGFYWIISNIVAILQQLFIAKFFPPRKSQAKLMIENTIYRRSREENLKKTRA